MSAAESTFPNVSSVVPTPLAKTIIDTVGVEVLDGAPHAISSDPKVPANGNHVIPFASTLRRVE